MKPEAVPACVTGLETGMVDAVITEIAGRLAELADSGDETLIDLRSLPMSDADRDALAEKLGQGEIRAMVDVAGLTEVWETSFPGIWWVRHLGADRKIASEQIAITRMPQVLVTHPDDIRDSVARIQLLNMTGDDSDHRKTGESLHV